jgi:hypothetical protein
MPISFCIICPIVGSGGILFYASSRTNIMHMVSVALATHLGKLNIGHDEMKAKQSFTYGYTCVCDSVLPDWAKFLQWGQRVEKVF